MRVPLSWLKEYIFLSLSPADVAKVLTNAGIEVENVNRLPLSFEGVVVGRITDVKEHPNAEKLVIATVTDGIEYFQVVCGAPNCRRGIKTAFAKIGATITTPEGKSYKIKKSRLRGEESCGMLCSGKELGLSEEAEGILELSDHAVEGKDLADLYADAILEIALTPNLNHCSSILGIARELSALTSHPVHLPLLKLREGEEPTNSVLQIENQAPTLCLSYFGRVIKGVTVGPSPKWLQERLMACGMRSINNVVDVTNYVLLEMGYPLHAFDLAKIAQKRITIRNARPQETLVTLDGIAHTLEETDLLICDPVQPLALAGIMGGASSQITEQTVDIALEAAYFLPTLIRRTSKRLNLHTESSRRFERGVDPHQALASLHRAADLISELAGGTVLRHALERREASFPPTVISCSVQRINQLLGTTLGLSEVETIFQRLQCRLTHEGEDVLQVQPPSYRVDLKSPVDLVEEVARVYGYNHIPKPPVRFSLSTLPHSAIYLFEQKVRSRLVAEGLQELLTCDLISLDQVEMIRDVVVSNEALIPLRNPRSQEHAFLRPTLLPSLLRVANANLAVGNDHLRGFEIGRIHFKSDGHYKEQTVVALLLMGKRRPLHWERKAEDCDFYDLKGLLENLLIALGVLRFSFKPSEWKTFHPGRQASLLADGAVVGSLGEVHPSTLHAFDLSTRLFFAEVNLHDLMGVKKQENSMRALAIYPASRRDWTLPLIPSCPAEEVLQAIGAMRSHLLEKYELTDVYYASEPHPSAKKITFSFLYRDAHKTLSDAEVEAEHRRITQGVMEKLSAKILNVEVL